ncbi:PTS IIA-like nitrogen regulatory protein PtsN [Alteromonas oceanisediminis]|uniref:PTS IIA-like nitrogen regulatory protein PtsN n=1 Tax=Alteromonas oceanisediminis TaxID=2836180 RepID=UPI001BDB3EDD|nr:PTS IIA-like nitrogen regulatory protein PtsN [Alteromonas oceanisediminis]MBT0585446.1 PTS IIA-like nitrogen regulatory protein PtsN [Alteromonas oceanisediminis]
MNLQAILSTNRTQCAVQCNSKKRILEIISQLAADNNSDIDKDTVLNALMSRERVGSTGIGNGIAIPHGRLSGLGRVMAIVVTSEPAIDFDAIDDKPVDIFFALLVPDDQNDVHLQMLSGIAGKLADKERVKLIRKAQTSDDIVQALS